MRMETPSGEEDEEEEEEEGEGVRRADFRLSSARSVRRFPPTLSLSAGWSVDEAGRG